MPSARLNWRVPADRDALKKSEAGLRAVVVPDWFAHQSQGVVCFDQRAPAERHFRFAKQLVRQDQEKQVRATIADQALEFCSAVQAVLQRGEFAENTAVTVMPDGGEIVRIIFRKERIAGAQGGVMDAEMFLEHLAAPAERTEPFARRVAATIVAAQIGPRLFAFENRGHARLFRTVADTLPRRRDNGIAAG